MPIQAPRLTDLPLSGQRVLVRADLNVPIRDGIISDDTRIRASLPTLRHALAQGAGVIVMSHLGRPEEGRLHVEDSLAPVAVRLAELLGCPVPLLDAWEGYRVLPGQVVMLENVRVNPGEKKNDPALGQRYAALCDVFVQDAFGTAHRAEASTCAVAHAAPCACMGLLMAAEIEALTRAWTQARAPLVAIVGGSKVSTKLGLLESLAHKVDTLVVGGGIANTFLLATGKVVGASLVERDQVDVARRILHTLEARGAHLPLPRDVWVGQRFAVDEPAVLKPVSDIVASDWIFDLGPQTLAEITPRIAQAGTLIWNGPLGVFEFPQFGRGTEALAQAIAQSHAFSIAGGGDTLAAIARYGVADRLGYISTGGGAFLEFLEGRTLPALAALADTYEPDSQSAAASSAASLQP